MSTFHKKRIKRNGFSLIELVISIALFTLVFAPYPHLMANIMMQLRESQKSASDDIHTVLMDMEYDFTLVDSISKVNMASLPNNIRITRLDDCLIEYRINGSVFEKNVITDPSGVGNCGRDFKAIDVDEGTFSITKQSGLNVFDVYAKKIWDTDGVHASKIKLRVLM